MAEELKRVLHRLKDYLPQTYPIHSLLLNSSETSWFNPSHDFPDPEKTYSEIYLPLLYFFKGFSSLNLNIRGSLDRHALLERKTGEKLRNLAPYFARYHIQPLIRDERENLNLSPEAREAYRLVLEESDMDLRYDYPETRRQKKEAGLLFPSLIGYFLPNLGRAMVHNWRGQGESSFWAHYFEDMGKSAARGAKVRHIPNWTNENRHLFFPGTQGTPWQFIMRVHEGVSLAPVVNELINRYSPFPDPPSLVVLAKQVMIRNNKIPVTQLIFAADLKYHYNETPDPEKIFPFAGVDISQGLPPEEISRYDTRSGPAATTREVLAHFKIRNEIDQGFEPGIEPPQGDLYLSFNQEELQKYRGLVDLGAGWENVTNEHTALEIGSRGIWQAIDEEVAYPEPMVRLADNALDRMEKRFKTSPNERWAEKGENPFQHRSICHNFLRSAILSPHRLVEYLGRAGLWDRFIKPKVGKTWEECLVGFSLNGEEYHRLVRSYLSKNKPTRDQSTDIVTGFKLGRMGETGRKYISGIALLDEACDLAKVFPQYGSDIERVFQLFYQCVGSV